MKGRAKIAMGISSMKAAITLMINRPEQGLEIVSMSKDNWVAQRELAFYPDGVGRVNSDFPLAGVTVGCKWQGHFVLGNAHKEKWVLSGTRIVDIDMEFFGPEWRGCTATLMRL